MSSLTDIQKLAVNKKDTNIIVSAGAGSGKTTVLKNRVLRILKSGITIDKLIILTFTNNAAQEMKDRIRKIINDNPDVHNNLELIDASYITTFDSFASSLVKKYNYLVDIDKNFSIVDSSLINRQMDIYIDEIFEEYYENNDEFKKLIKDLCVKNDTKIRSDIKKIYKSITNVINRREFLSTYIDTYFSDELIEELFSKFEDHLFRLRDEVSSLYEGIKDETIDEEILRLNDQHISNFNYATTYDELMDSLNFSFERYSAKRYTEEFKAIRDEITNVIKKIKSFKLADSKKEIIDNYKSSINYAKVIVSILIILDDKLNKFKHDNNSYEFFDIAYKAIDIVKNNESVRESIKNNTYEIMIDEYQDTNDIQEEFISYIANNNVYMVGDIKQSIYRFRNANPYIFKNKYDNYKDGKNGFKIDLMENFRSRFEVVKAINEVFDNIMFDDIGGANYKSEHQMIYGNKEYEKFNLNSNYNMEILNYNNDDNKYDSKEAECFIIANDIIKRISNHEQITYMDKDKMCSRNIDYKDFVILVDKSKNFDLLKRILESKNIPAIIDKDVSVKEDAEIYILKNLITLIIKVKEKCFDNEFKHAWISIARSYVGNLSDKEIFDIVTNNKYNETEIIKTILNITLECDSLGIVKLLELLIDRFDIINKTMLDGNIDDKLTKLELFINNAKNLNNIGYDLYSINDYFDELLNGDNDIKMSRNSSSGNVVTIMTIHGSKGLEYPYVYLPFLDSDFTKTPDVPLLDFNQSIGIITPYTNEGYANTFTFYLNKIIERKETLSEKIRLFYVALTRAKEKIIIINKENLSIESEINIPYSKLMNVKKLSDFINYLRIPLSSYFRNINLDDVGISKDYNNSKELELKLNNSNEVIETRELVIDNKVLDNRHFSKTLSKVIDKEFKERLDFGTYMHYVFEVCDFKINNIDTLNISDEAKDKIKNFLSHDEVKNIKESDIYKEKEIMYVSNGIKYHGFIDLLLVYKDHADIIDYKLSNIESEEYKVQLNGYKDYIENTLKIKTNIYLYSINKDIFKKLD